MTSAAPASAPAASRPARECSSPSTAFCVPADITEARAAAESAEPNEAAEPTENAEATDPTDPIENTEPTEPTESREPFDAIERNESSDQSERVGPSWGMRFTAQVSHRPSFAA